MRQATVHCAVVIVLGALADTSVGQEEHALATATAQQLPEPVEVLARQEEDEGLHLDFASAVPAHDLLSLTSALGMFRQAQEDDHHSDAHDSESIPPPFGTSLTEHWLDPWPHTHFSRQGTPFVHLFLTEPAFLDRDLFLDYRIIRGADENEMELEAELEWAFTRRIGLVIEAPYRLLDPEGAPNENGFGDMAIAPRVLLVDTERFLLSGNLEIGIATGNERRGLGSGETSLSPTFSWWYDLGKWVTFQGQIGTEHALDSGDAEFLWKAAITYSLLGPTLPGTSSGVSTHGGRHFPPGLINFITELTGRTPLNGEQEGRSTAEILFGVSYLLTSEWEIRAGLQFPLFEPREFDNGYVIGLIHHF